MGFSEIGSKKSPIPLDPYGENTDLNLQFIENLVSFSLFTIFPCGKV